MASFYLTTTLPYVNAKPHIGHALEFVQADVICRWRRQQGDAVLFNVGTDEHGLKILQKAQEWGMEVQDFIAGNVKTFEDFFTQFSITRDNFYRTSVPSHHPVAQGIWKLCEQKGDIYKKTYTGKYCVGCESFKTPKDLVDGKCPDHGVEPQDFEQENYFFKLSAYKNQLHDYYTQNDALLPKNKLNELLNFIDGMEDISISRTKESLPRGVPVPGDESQVMYVWFDALSNYIGAAWFPDDMHKVEAFWPWVQIFGPDNLRFQCAIRQGMLASAGFPFTKQFLMHGMVLGPDGNKMSKTLGNVISPMDQLEKWGAEAVRFYLIAWIPTFGDASYKEEDLVNLRNSRAANAFGNLLSRVIALATKKELSLHTTMLSDAVSEHIDHVRNHVTKLYDTYELFEAAGAIHDLALRANKYLDENKPREATTDPLVAQQTLINLWALLYTLIDLYTPLIPSVCAQAKAALDSQEKCVLCTKLTLQWDL
jgi:methionyl-tRNA synthetase